MSDSEALQIFLKSPVTQDMIHHLVTVTLQILPCESSKTIVQQLPSPPNSPPVLKTKPLPSLMTFITKLVRYTNVYTGTLMSTIVYMHRLKERLPKDAKGLPCTRHRIFLACLIISSKYFNDSSPKNKHWAKYTDGLFRKEDVNLMERQLLMLLDWDIQIETDELLPVWKRFLDPIKQDLKKQSKIRNSLSKGMLAGSTQTIVVPKNLKDSTKLKNRKNSVSTDLLSNHTRNSSVSTVDSYMSSTNSLHSRASSVSSIGSVNEQMPLSSSQQLLKESYDPSFASGYKQQQLQLQPQLQPQSQSQPQPQPQNNVITGGYSLDSNSPLNEYLKTVALKEEQELNTLIRQYCGY